MEPESSEGLQVLVKDFGFYSKYDEKPLKHFKMGNSMIRFIFYKSYFICSLEGSRNLMNGGEKKSLNF